MATFVLFNINLQVSPGSFSLTSKKILKVEAANQKAPSAVTLIKLKQHAEVLSEQSLQWHETLTLPAKYGYSFPFQVVSQQEGFGYNPQDIDSVLKGRIIVEKGQGDYCGWEVFSKEEKVGFLFANIEVRSKMGTKQIPKAIENNSSFFGSTIDLSSNSVAFLSLYGSFPHLAAIDKRRAFFQFQLGSFTCRSAIKKLHQNEYKSHEILQVKHTNPKADKLTVSAFTFDAHFNRIELLGKGSTKLILPLHDTSTLSLDERVKLERVFLQKQGEEIGWVSFKYLKAKEGKDESLDPRYFLQDKFATIGDVNFRPLNSTTTIADGVRSRVNMSGLETNSRIFMPRAPRFDNPAKRKACQQIGLLHQSVNLRELPSTSRYRVPSLGYGHKIQPVERDHDVPGTGRYQLPSLFDCFKPQHF